MRIRKSLEAFPFVCRPKTIAVATALVAIATASQAQPIAVPNYSFESQSGVGQPFGVSVLVDSWQKPAKPAYFDVIEQNFGIYWIQTAGVFVDTNPYGNGVGTQAGYILSFPQAGLSQDYDTMDWNDAAPSHDFNATFEIGKSYNLTVGFFGKVLSLGGLSDGSLLQLSLYYRNGVDLVTVGATTITYTAAGFPVTPNLNLIDYQVNIPTIQASDAWAGQRIGIKIESLYGDGSVNWDFDNVRLTAVPEPSTLALLAMGGFVVTRLRRARG